MLNHTSNSTVYDKYVSSFYTSTGRIRICIFLCVHTTTVCLLVHEQRMYMWYMYVHCVYVNSEYVCHGVGVVTVWCVMYFCFILVLLVCVCVAEVKTITFCIISYCALLIASTLSPYSFLCHNISSWLFILTADGPLNTKITDTIVHVISFTIFINRKGMWNYLSCKHALNFICHYPANVCGHWYSASNKSIIPGGLYSENLVSQLV